MSFFDRCPNCDEERGVNSLCLCTYEEIQEAAELRRRMDRDDRLSRGRPVLVDHTKRPDESGADDEPYRNAEYTLALDGLACRYQPLA